MKKVKKLLSILLVAVMLVCIAPITDLGIKASAASLSEIQNKYPQGSYWNGEYSNAWQCHGFALMVADMFYGSGQARSFPTSYNYDAVKAGDIIRHNSSAGGHTAWVIAVNGDDLTLGECNYRISNGVDWTRHITKSWLKSNGQYVLSAPYDMNGHNPTPNLESCTGGEGTISISGWVFDADDYNASIEIHVYIGEEGNRDGHSGIIANKYRPDVNAAYGCGDYHGFSETITTNKRGTQSVAIAAINVGEGDTVWFWTGEVTIDETYVEKDMYFSHITKVDNTDSGLSSVDSPISGQFKYWFKKRTNETNYYINFYVDNNLIRDHDSTDTNGWYSYVVDTSTFSNGIHELKLCYVHTYGSVTVTKTINIYNGIVYFGVSSVDNSDWSLSNTETPIISGEYKIWFKKLISDKNYYINIFVDNKIVVDHGSVDDFNYISYVVNSDNYDNGIHEIKAILAHTNGSESVVQKFKIQKYKINFNANGGSCSTSSKTVTYDSAYGTLPTPTRAGYTFAGWFTAASGGTKLESSTKVTITSNQTLYAHWTANSYSVSFNTNGGNVSASSKNAIFDSAYGDLPVPTREGYKFDGWFTEAEGGTLVTSETIVTATADHTLYAHWSGISAKEGSTAVIDGSNIYGLKTKLTAANVKNTFLDYEGVEVTLTKAIEDARYYGTGSTVTVKYSDGTEEVYTIIIFGDIDGNAIIDSDDAFSVLEASYDNSLFNAAQKKAANVDGVRRISIDDYSIINDAALGISEIDQTAV